MRHNSEKEYVCPFGDNDSVEALAVLHILLRPGHYDLLYTPSIEFPLRILKELSGSQEAILAQHAEEKMVIRYSDSQANEKYHSDSKQSATGS